MPAPRHLSAYSNVAFEILVVGLTLMPVIVLVFFYQQLPAQIPVFLNLRGEVEVWAAKSVASVFRLSAMAFDLQLLCFLMKYGTVKSQTDVEEVLAHHQERMVRLTTRLWDSFRLLVAVKLAAASLDVVFIGVGWLRFLWRPAWLLTWAAAIGSIVAAGWYGYRLWQMKRDLKTLPAPSVLQHATRERLMAGIIYFNPKDQALFVEKYLLNFGNKWVYVLIACLVAYPLLVFLPA